MYLFRTIVFCLLVSNTCLLSDNIREWESIDGKVLKAEFISANERYVTIRRQSDGRRFTIKITQISEKDKCKDCNGKKVVKEKKVLECAVDKGAPH